MLERPASSHSTGAGGHWVVFDRVEDKSVANPHIEYMDPMSGTRWQNSTYKNMPTRPYDGTNTDYGGPYYWGGLPGYPKPPPPHAVSVTVS